MAEQRIALFGGTFDPIHLGHTKVAEYAAGKIGAERVIFIPAKKSPLKKSPPAASDFDRLEMIRLATEDTECLSVSDYELKKDEPSFTLHTVEKFKADFDDRSCIYWLAGADAVTELGRWYKIEQLIDSCRLSVMYRADCEPPDFNRYRDIWGDELVDRLVRNIIRTPLIEISSTEIRSRLRAGLDVSEMLDAKVAKYIRKKGLYSP